MKSRYLPRRRPSPHNPVPFPDGGTYECLRCEREWRGPSGPQECPACQSTQVEWLNYTHPEELLLPEGAALPAGVPQVLPNKEIYLLSEDDTRPAPQGRWKITRGS